MATAALPTRSPQPAAEPSAAGRRQRQALAARSLQRGRLQGLGQAVPQPLVAGRAVAQLAFGIIAEAALSYIGLGVQPPATSLGVLLHDAQSFGLAKPLLVIVPGLVIVLIVLALNLTSWQLRWTVAADLREDDRGAA